MIPLEDFELDVTSVIEQYLDAVDLIDLLETVGVTIAKRVESSRERSLALTKLEEAEMWLERILPDDDEDEVDQ